MAGAQAEPEAARQRQGCQGHLHQCPPLSHPVLELGQALPLGLVLELVLELVLVLELLVWMGEVQVVLTLLLWLLSWPGLSEGGMWDSRCR